MKIRPAEPALVMLSGLPGSGKTTFAHRLLERLDAVHIESDAIRRELFAEPRYVAEEHARVFRTAEDRARSALERGASVVFDATNLTTKDRRRFVRLAERLGCPLVAARMVAPAETIRARLSRPRDGWSRADVRVFESMQHRGQPFPVPVVVADTRFDITPAVELVVSLATPGQADPEPAPVAAAHPETP
ncbi:MAG: AAA family ATPase [Hyphomicrobiales bacterium]